MENQDFGQGKRPDQVEKSTKMVAYALAAMLLWFVANAIF